MVNQLIQLMLSAKNSLYATNVLTSILVEVATQKKEVTNGVKLMTPMDNKLMFDVKMTTLKDHLTDALDLSANVIEFWLLVWLLFTTNGTLLITLGGLL